MRQDFILRIAYATWVIEETVLPYYNYLPMLAIHREAQPGNV